ncbi:MULTISPECIES: anti-sigma factor domain-containing protein [Bacillus]|uniref:RsgI N-terminal anti-sigma domain-containing protein n=1 Tax=Bacillus capparidis TaxID=1840411 RepID=A0ABS4CR43_9BACI|nr:MULTISPECIES: anti-sigma factor domain-containing protein [Bacillus]MBP1079770.1 hypothetical protein [Bacillus capparidis]MED1095162.1 anti-sigma factor domain-containing protein [Bacillus capparidis]
MKKGIVVEKSGGIVTLLTPDGQFLKTKQHESICEIGEEITFMPETRVDRRRAGFFDLLRLRPVQSGVISIAAIVLFVFTILPMFADNKAYAYMTIDINPSFELTLDSKCQVLSISALNAEGENLLNGMNDWRKKDVRKVVDEIIANSSKSHYLVKNQEILISTVFENDTQNTYQTDVNNRIDEISTNYRKKDYKMRTLKSDLDTRKKAKEQGVSTGKYLEGEEQSKVLEKEPDSKSDDNLSNDSEEKESSKTPGIDTDKETSEQEDRNENIPNDAEKDQTSDNVPAEDETEKSEDGNPENVPEKPSDKDQQNDEEENESWSGEKDDNENETNKNDEKDDNEDKTNKNDNKDEIHKNEKEDRKNDLHDRKNEHEENKDESYYSKKKWKDNDEFFLSKYDKKRERREEREESDKRNKQHSEKKPPRNPGD